MSNEYVKCPLTSQPTAKKIKDHKSEDVIKVYKNELNMDVSRFFKEPLFGQYECEVTGFRFFLPESTSGDAEYYSQMEENQWYYPEEKWEYGFVLDKIRPEDAILEIGSGEGFFLNKINKKGATALGLELNHKAAAFAQKKGLNVIVEPIQKHISNNIKRYDIICSFQVMEHIYEVKDVIEASLALLKEKGKLIICVPNNDSFIKKDLTNVLNLPPHHIGLWNKEALKSIEKLFPLKLLELKEEPLQECHLLWYSRIFRENYIDTTPILRSFFYRLGGEEILNKTLKRFNKLFRGMSVIATYQKK